MNIINDLISWLKEDSLVCESKIREVYTCALWTAVVSRGCGLSSTFKENHPNHGKVRDVGSQRGKAALELAEYANSDNLLEASIGMATINSLIDVDESKCVKENAFDILARRGSGKKVAIVGHFPWIPQLREIAGKLWVIEKRPRGEDLPAEVAGEILPQADVVGITGTSLINHTFEELIGLCKNSFVVMVGPTSPLSPVLFDYGVDVIGGLKVINQDSVIRCISEGAMFKQINGIKMINMIRRD